MELQKKIGANIKAIREQKKLTLDTAAKLTGVSRSMLAQIERGDVNPTISVLWKIANGFKVSFTSLMPQASHAPLVIRADQVSPLVEDEGRYRNYPAFPFQDGRQFETYRIEILPGGHLAAQPHMAGTEEYITIFAGEVVISVGEERFPLSEGDSLRFAADVPHGYENSGDRPAVMSMLIYYAAE